MWICLSDAFLSIVDKGDPTHATLLVRARRAGDIERVFPEAEVSAKGGSDYAFRARLPRRHDVYMDIWAVLARDQDGTQGR
jgi:hypothetical protein